jgi:hypothetical protein
VAVQLMTKSLLAEVDGDGLVVHQHPHSPNFDFIAAGISTSLLPARWRRGRDSRPLSC